ncbi:hypothetical protein DW777_15870, partial [Bacteroides sp. AM30-16]
NILFISLADTVQITASLLSIKDTPSFQNAKHDAWIDGVLFEGIDVNTRYLKVAFEADTPVYMDELFVNPVIR